MLGFTIHPLHKKPEHAETCAAWSYGQWGVHMTERCLDDYINRYKKRIENRDKLPITWLLFEGDNVAGAATLSEDDHDDYTHLSPWLASVFVHPTFRGKGYATALSKHVQDEAKKLGYNSLYLYTPNATGLYQKFGWKIKSEGKDPRGIFQNGNLMEINL